MNRPERCAYLYARVKATMTLRTSGELQGTSGPRHRRLRLLALVAAATVVLLTLLAGGSGAGISAYQGTLYFAGPASSISGSFQMTTAAPAARGDRGRALRGRGRIGGST